MRIAAAIAVTWIALGIAAAIGHHMAKRAVQRNARREHMRERLNQ